MPANNVKRLFISVDLPSTIKAELIAYQLKSGDIKWNNPEQLHITVYFLGNADGAKIPIIKKIIQRVTVGFKPFTLKLTGIHVERSNMIWISIEDATRNLAEIHNRLKKEFGRENLGQETTNRPFKPHILLGKYKFPTIHPQDPVVADIGKNFVTVSLEADVINLYESLLLANGARYNKIAEAHLGMENTA